VARRSGSDVATHVTPTYREGTRSWLADELLEPTKLVFAVVIAESLSEYRNVVRSPFHNDHFIATIALVGIYLTTIWSWFGWHRAQLGSPYVVQDPDGSTNRWEVWRFYTDVAIVVAYAYTLFQVEPVVDHPGHDLVWLLFGYVIVIVLYLFENFFRRQQYGPEVRRAVPLTITLGLYVFLTLGYVYTRRAIEPVKADARSLLWLNGATLAVYIFVMWFYRHPLNEGYKKRIAKSQSG
jgi:hypothetical protein